MSEKLQKIIASAGLMSRRAAEEAISAGRVTVNGRPAALGDRAEADADQICVDGRPLPREGRRYYIALNKPRGYVCSMKDEQGRHQVSELVEELDARLYPVGRLDLNSEGLLIMTNDGAFANRLMHPSHQVEKSYRTWVRGERAGERAELLRSPMEIDGYRVKGASVVVESTEPGGATLLVTICEGRNRQVRKMCEKAGLRVTRLCRVREGAVKLGNLPSGKWRHLTPDELRKLGLSDGEE